MKRIKVEDEKEYCTRIQFNVRKPGFDYQKSFERFRQGVYINDSSLKAMINGIVQDEFPFVDFLEVENIRLSYFEKLDKAPL